MSTSADLVRKMILAHADRDDKNFRAAVEQYIAEERRKNHHVLARDLERILANGLVTSGPSDTYNSYNLLGISASDLPKDKERGAVLVEVIEPRRSIDDLVLTSHVQESLERIILENRRIELLRSYGLRPAGKVLFCGPPGCGKTVASEAVAEALYLPLVLVRFDAVVSSYLGETAANLRKVFDFARSRPMVMLFDEFDAIGKNRVATEEHGELKRVVNSFLQMLDGFRSESLLIAATNHQGLLDAALWRRFDDIIFFERPDRPAIVEVLRRNLHQIGIAPGVVLEEHARDLLDASHSDVERVARDAIKEAVLQNRSQISSDILTRAIVRHQARAALSHSDLGNTPVSDL